MLNRLSNKLVVAVAAALLTVMVAGFILLNHQLIRGAEYDILQSYSREIQQTGDNLDTYTAGLEDTLLSLLCDTRLQEAINRPQEEETLENQQAEIRTLCEVVSYVESNRHVNRVRLYLSDGKSISREQVNFFSHTDALDTPEYQEMTGRRMSLHWMGLHRVQPPYADEDYLTLGLLYRGNFLSESRNWALILLDLLPGMFTDALDQIASAYDGAQALIADSAGNVMVGGDRPLWLDALNGHGWNGGLGYFDCNGQEYAYVCQSLGAADWSIAVAVPRESLRNSQQTLQTAILFVLGLLIIALLTLISMTLYARSIRRYIYALNESLQQSGDADTTSIPAHRALFNLDRNIACLRETNRKLTENKLETQLREQDVTLQALQAQINLHFLYNTLDAINWMAIREHCTEVSETITTLADYFRLSLSQGRSVVTLEEDAEITRKYLDLYKRRYDYVYTVEWDLQPQSLKCPLTRLTLQPLVENVLCHGIFMRDQKEGGRLVIRSFTEDSGLMLTVVDNGPGLKTARTLPRASALRTFANGLTCIITTAIRWSWYRCRRAGSRLRCAFRDEVMTAAGLPVLIALLRSHQPAFPGFSHEKGLLLQRWCCGRRLLCCPAARLSGSRVKESLVSASDACRRRDKQPRGCLPAREVSASAGLSPSGRWWQCPPPGTSAGR